MMLKRVMGVIVYTVAILTVFIALSILALFEIFPTMARTGFGWPLPFFTLGFPFLAAGSFSPINLFFDLLIISVAWWAAFLLGSKLKTHPKIASVVIFFFIIFALSTILSALSTVLGSGFCCG